ncbi:hypothetical protein RDWZM_000661 [Blomia tropicalis]|uniref:Protein ECT2 n=1 Tax=Blomia tropicalis TaxID=40697 RepID=A0A9Q0RQN7_BLOTA|nr:hypothetical protein RDWZM_000661 [Blomia tropicalis]
MTTHRIDRIILIEQELYDNQTFISTLKEVMITLLQPQYIHHNSTFVFQQNFTVPIELQLKLESSDANAQNVIYISSRFEGTLFEQLSANKKPIISDIIVYQCIANRNALPNPKHPLFNFHMKDFVICFSINDKRKTNVINRYLSLIRFMGGQSRRDMKSGKSFDRTHLIESTTDSDNYKLATIYGIPILSKEWIDFVWENRRNADFISDDSTHLEKYRLKPFTGMKISLLNFPDDQIEQLTKNITENDGILVPIDDEHCSHLVINNAKTINYIEILEKLDSCPQFVVSEKWLFDSLSKKNREDEDAHKLKVPHLEKNVLNTPSKDDSIAYQTMNSLLLSPNYDNSIDNSLQVDKTDLKKQAITQELYQTEKNYVKILKDIIKVFREPLKNHQLPGQFPNEIELKTIFGGLPPIIEVHDKILAELEPIAMNWKAENQVGKIFQKHSKDFLTVYPQYINFYEKTKETIELCSEKYEKFSSFLKACQILPECRKQTFQELLINPIQRLPRIEMYIRALLNKTDNSHPDYKLLNEALNTIVSVNSEINQEKKKAAGQIEMFNILNDIEDCPATLLSANRHLISKCDARLLMSEDNVIHKLDNYLFSLLLFTDLILLCKKRTVKRTNSLRDRTTSSTVTKKTKKSYKYIETIDLSLMHNVIHKFEDNEIFVDCENTFVIITSSNLGTQFLTYPFVVKDVEMKRDTFTNDLIKAVELLADGTTDLNSNTCKLGDLDYSHSKTIARNLNKSKYVFLRTKEKINRKFSVRRTTTNLSFSVSMENLNAPASLPSTPHTNRFSRVINNLNFLTPREYDTQIKRSSHKIGSTNDLCTTDEANENFSLPTTPAPRKKKYQEKTPGS